MNLIISIIKKTLSLRLKQINSVHSFDSNSILKKEHQVEEFKFDYVLNSEDKENGHNLYHSVLSYLNIHKFILKGNYFYFENNHLNNKKGNIFYEKGVDYIPACHKISLKKKKILNGSCAYISNTEPQHYGHFIMFILPLLRFYENEDFFKKPDYYYIGDITLKKFHLTIFKLFNIPINKIINYPCRAKEIYYVSLDRRTSGYRKNYWDYQSFLYVKQELKKLMRPCKEKRIYIKRGQVKWRNIVNENDILKILEKYNFEIYSMDDKPIEMQSRIFSEASIIIAPHGAALTNLIFCHEKTKIIELFPFGYEDTTSFVYAYYNKNEYLRLVGNKYDILNQPCYRDMYINVEKLECLIKKIIV